MNTKEWNAKFIMYRRTIKHLKDAVNHDLSTQGISLQHATYLLLLADKGNLKIKELNELSDNDAALTSRVLKVLYEKNYIGRTGESIRKCKIFLTEKGNDVVKFIGETFARLRENAIDSLGDGGKDIFLNLILS
ncbi:MAG: hypothetical protein EOM77_01015 [Bacteroidia bacterium]|nr:hypothetical protein [Bacteroidia bacterium]